MIKTNYKYFKQLRMDFIWEMVNIYGYVNHIHLERKFDISTVQAAADFESFIHRNPDTIEYNKSTKRYERKGFPENIF